MIAFRLLPIAVLLAPLPAAAEPEAVQVGQWLVMRSGTESCQAVAFLDDHMLVIISEDATGNGSFVFSDDRWQLDEKEFEAGTVSWDEWKNSEAISFSVARMVAGRWALVSETGPWFTENLAESERLWLRVPEVGFDDNFTIDNTMDVLTALATCNSQL